jgi:NADH:ubiquinone oxidoreductase subunit D
MTQDSEQHDANFLGLVYSLYQSAMIQMGKLTHPETGGVERDLPAARVSIDLLETLAHKTRGNLNEGEDKLLKNMLTELRLNYVGEAEKEGKPAEAAAEEPATDEDGQPDDGKD